MFDVWMGMKIGGATIGAIGTIGGIVATQKRQEEKFDNMLTGLEQKFVDKFDLDSNNNEEIPQ